MPNTNPQTTTISELKNKFEIAAKILFQIIRLCLVEPIIILEIEKLDFSQIPV